jgi:WD40 repeat protein
VRVFFNSAGGFQSIGYTPGGQVLTLDNHARLAGWDVVGGRSVRFVAPPSPGRWALLKGFRSADGLVGVLTSASFHRFHLASRTELPRVNANDGRVAEVSEDGTLAVVNERGSLRWRLWNLDTGAPLPEHFDLAGESAEKFRYHPVLAPDNRTFALSAVGDGRLWVWDRDDPKPRLLVGARGRRHFPLLAFPPDGRFLVAAQVARAGVVGLWDLPAGKLRWSVPQDIFVWAVAVHPSGNLVAVATVGGAAGRVVRFLDAATGGEVARFNWNAGRVRCVTFSPDGLTCAAGCSDRRLVVWDVDQ